MTRTGGRRRGSHLEQAARTRAELAEAVPQVTQRQLEYWVAKGWIIPDGPAVQGHPRSFSEPEKQVLKVLARLTAAGFGGALAAQVARRAVTAAGSAVPGDGRAAIALDADLSLVLVIEGI